MDAKVVNLLKEQVWYLGTYSDEPNAVPVVFKDVAEDGKLLVGDVFLNVTLKNVKANGKIAVSACNAKTMEGYQIKGRAEYVPEGPVVETFKKVIGQMTNGALTAKGVLVITPEKVFVTTPNGNNGQEL